MECHLVCCMTGFISLDIFRDKGSQYIQSCLKFVFWLDAEFWYGIYVLYFATVLLNKM